MKTILKKSSYWLSIVTIGIVLGISLQFVRAWVEPTAAPPGSNVGAPINTGDGNQTKTGGIGTLGNFRVVGTTSTAGKVGIKVPVVNDIPIISSDLSLDVEGKVGASQYCDQNGASCKTASAMGSDGTCRLCKSCGGSWTLQVGWFQYLRGTEGLGDGCVGFYRNVSDPSMFLCCSG